jgi:F-type H+-transporting ATPase subunit delta
VLIASHNSFHGDLLMASKLASGDLIADRYASALYDLAADSKSVDPVLADLTLLQTMLNDHKDLHLVIKSPLIASTDKLDILEKLLLNIKANKLTLTFLKVLEQNKRFSNLYSIISQFININAYNRGDVLADITSAEELNDEQRKNIKEQLKNTLGEKLSLKFIVDKKIIGGLVVKVGSKMIDTSLANKINKLKIAMKGA